MTANGRGKVSELGPSELLRPPWKFAPCSVHLKNALPVSSSHRGHEAPRDGATSPVYRGQIGYFLARLGDWKYQCLDVVKNLVILVKQSWVQILTTLPPAPNLAIGGFRASFCFFTSLSFHLVH